MSTVVDLQFAVGKVPNLKYKNPRREQIGKRRLKSEWKDKLPWLRGPIRQIRWWGWCGLVRNERTIPNRCDRLQQWWTCIRPKYSTTWWSCREIRRRFVCCQQRKLPTARPEITDFGVKSKSTTARTRLPRLAKNSITYSDWILDP